MAEHTPPAGAPLYTHPDRRECWYDVDGEAWWRYEQDHVRCFRAHHHPLVPGEPAFAAEDTALADLAEILAPPMRDRLRVLLADATGA